MWPFLPLALLFFPFSSLCLFPFALCVIFFLTPSLFYLLFHNKLQAFSKLFASSFPSVFKQAKSDLNEHLKGNLSEQKTTQKGNI